LDHVLGHADASKRHIGRPIDTDKRDHIVATASDLFIAHGVSGTSIEAIARAANVSKVTIYNRFGDKTALFVECIAQECREMQALLRIDDDQPRDLRDHLRHYGMAMLNFLARDQLVRFENMLGGEMARHPELGELFLEAGPRRMLRGLADVIAAAAARGEIHVADPLRAANMLAGMMKGFADLERRFAMHESVDFVSEDRIDYAVDTFLAAHS
jgi:TetR/AcrR family transcriptional regulator, mexJK operon transcriptional repressor